MASVRLPEAIETRLEHLAAATKRSKSFYVVQALEQYLEDLEDGFLALERSLQPKAAYHSTAEVLKALQGPKRAAAKKKR